MEHNIIRSIRSASYDFTELSDRTIRQNPEWGQGESLTLIDELNIVDGTYYLYFSPEIFGAFALQYDLDGGVAGPGIIMTIEGTIQDDTTEMDSCQYNDHTNAAFGVANVTVASGATADDAWIDNDNFFKCFKYVRIKLDIDTSSGNTADVTLFLRQRY